MLLAEDDSPSLRILQNIEFRLESARQLATHVLLGETEFENDNPASPLDRRRAIIQHRRKTLFGESPFAVERNEDEVAQLPDNVNILAENPDEEQLRIAQERASEFKQITLMESGKVSAVGHTTGGSVELRAPQERFTVDRRIEPEGTQEESGDSDQEVEMSPTPSMSEAANKVSR